MYSRLAWMIPTAFSILFIFCAQGFLLPILLVPAGISFLATLYVLYRDFRPSGKYDLKALKELEDKDELANLAPEVGVFEFDTYLCPYCNTHFSTEFRQCPKCGRTRSRY